MPGPVLVDTSALFALASASDQFHQRAAEQYRWLARRNTELYITSYALAETITLTQRRLGFAATQALVESIEGIINHYWITPSTHQAAWSLLRARNGARLSLADCSVIVVAQRLEAPVFGFDPDFRAEGLTLIPD